MSFSRDIGRGCMTLVASALAVTCSAEIASGATRPIPGQIMVMFDKSSSAASRGAAHGKVAAELGAVADVASRSRGAFALDVVRVPPGKERAALRAYGALDDVVVADQDSENTSPLAVDDCAAPVTCFIPNDPGFPKQWHLQNNSQTVAPPGVTLKEDADVDAPRVWPTTKGSGGIAVLDDGLDLSHPDLLRSRGSVYDGTGENTIQSYGGHGTHVAGIIAATQDNGLGVSGLAPDSVIYPCRVLQVKKKGTSSTTTSSSSWLAACLNWAMSQQVGVINMSLQNYAYSDLLQEAITRAWDAGIVIVAAAGNGGSTVPNYPAAFDHVVAVASLRADDLMASTSNRGSWVDVAAPGQDIWSTVPTYANSTSLLSYGYLSGTSMAAPVVSALATMVGQDVTDDDGTGGKVNDEIVERIFATADDISGTGTNWREGAINAAQALENVDLNRLYADEVIATPGLVSYWRLNEPNATLGAIDSVGGNTGVYEQPIGATPFGFGARGALLTSNDAAVTMSQGDGITTWRAGTITAYYKPSLAVGSEFTVEFWVRPLDDAPTRPPFSYLLQLGSQATGRFQVSGGVGPTEMHIFAGSESGGVASSVPLSYGWNYVVAVKSGPSTRLYINGLDVSTDERAGGISFVDEATLTLGSSYSPEAYDDAAIYRRALTPNEISRHYAAAVQVGRR